MLIQANAASVPLRDASVQCVVTSPPYWGLRDYGLPPLVWGGEAGCEHEWGDEQIANRKDSNRGQMEWTTGGNPAAKVLGVAPSQGSFCLRCSAWRGSLGLEPTPELYVQHLVEVFREVKRVLRDDGTLWCNLGDAFQNKQLQGMPWRVAFALQADGWYLRSDIIWSKPNPMPESVTDRPTKAHEYLFLLAKSERYYYDAEAIKEPLQESSLERGYTYVGRDESSPKMLAAPQDVRAKANWRVNGYVPNGRNRRSVWTIATQPYPEAHFATFPEDLVTPCVLAGCPPGGTVLDPFAGSGTVGEVCARLGRQAVLVELAPHYLGLAQRRTAQRGLGV